MGREEQARARRKADAQEDNALAELLGKNNPHVSGGVCSASSREALMIVQKARKAMTEAKERNTDPKAVSQAEQPALPTKNDDEAQLQRKKYSAEIVKRLGFDPTIKGFGRIGMKPKTSDSTSKVSNYTCSITINVDSSLTA